MILEIKEEIKSWFSHPTNFTNIDFKYYNQVKLSVLYDVLRKSLFNTVVIICIILLFSGLPEFDKTKFSEYFQNILSLYLSVYLVFYTVRIALFILYPIQKKNNNSSDLKGKYSIVFLLAVILIIYTTVDDIIFSGISHSFLFGILILTVLRLIYYSFFFIFKKIPTHYYSGNSVVKKQMYIDDISNSTSLKTYYNKYLFFEMDYVISGGHIMGEEIKLDGNRVLSYALFNDNVLPEYLYKLYIELNAKIIDLSSMQYNCLKFNKFDIEDKTRTLIFINGPKINTRDFQSMITDFESQRNYIYINGKSVLPCFWEYK